MSDHDEMLQEIADWRDLALEGSKACDRACVTMARLTLRLVESQKKVAALVALVEELAPEPGKDKTNWALGLTMSIDRNQFAKRRLKEILEP